MMHDMTSFIGPLSNGPTRAPWTAFGRYLRNSDTTNESRHDMIFAQALVELGDVYPHNLLAQERDQFFDASFEHVNTLALLCNNAPSLLLHNP